MHHGRWLSKRQEVPARYPAGTLQLPGRHLEGTQPAARLRSTREPTPARAAATARARSHPAVAPLQPHPARCPTATLPLLPPLISNRTPVHQQGPGQARAALTPPNAAAVCPRCLRSKVARRTVAARPSGSSGPPVTRTSHSLHASVSAPPPLPSTACRPHPRHLRLGDAVQVTRLLGRRKQPEDGAGLVVPAGELMVLLDHRVEDGLRPWWKGEGRRAGGGGKQRRGDAGTAALRGPRLQAWKTRRVQPQVWGGAPRTRMILKHRPQGRHGAHARAATRGLTRGRGGSGAAGAAAGHGRRRAAPPAAAQWHHSSGRAPPSSTGRRRQRWQPKLVLHEVADDGGRGLDDEGRT
jgi:hypothetical protein